MADWDYPSIVSSFPSVRHAFAYGSAAFFQPGLYEDGKRPMLDLILVVDSPSYWHRLVWPVAQVNAAATETCRLVSTLLIKGVLCLRIYKRTSVIIRASRG